MGVPTTQLAKMSIDLKFAELRADVLEIFFTKWVHTTEDCIPILYTPEYLLMPKRRGVVCRRGGSFVYFSQSAFGSSMAHLKRGPSEKRRCQETVKSVKGTRPAVSQGCHTDRSTLKASSLSSVKPIFGENCRRSRGGSAVS